MEDVYRRLAAKLEALPFGFPPTESGVEIAILRKIFSPEDAAFALDLLPVPETLEAVARRLRRPAAELEPTLEGMAARGQIGVGFLRGRRVYQFVPFVIGIYEFQLPHMDAELATLAEQYLPALTRAIGATEPALARVVPVNAHIDARAQVLAHEDVRRMLAGAVSFLLMECVCTKEQSALGKECRHMRERCLAFSSEPGAYERFPYGRTVTREEALAVVEAAEREGLVHCTYNVRQEQLFLCNCCSCCCGFLRGLRDFEAPHFLVHSNYVAAIDQRACVVCGDCGGDRCPMGAISEHEAAWSVAAERCIGCGACTLACPADAIALVPRPKAERTKPPKHIMSWAFRRAVGRAGPVRAIAQFGALTAKTLAASRGEPRRG